MQDKFKVFLHKGLEDSPAFIDSYQEKIKKDSQYQLEEILDQAAYLEYLQAVLRKFNLFMALNKDILTQYFQKDLRPSIYVQFNAQGQKQDSWKKAIKKTVDAEAKTLL